MSHLALIIASRQQMRRCHPSVTGNLLSFAAGVVSLYKLMTPHHRADATFSAASPTRSGSPFFNSHGCHAGIRLLQRLAENWMGISKIYRLHDIVQSRLSSGCGQPCFFASLLTTLNVRWEISLADRDRIPGTGPLLVVANHPFGMVEGLVLGALLRTIRPDVRILANSLLQNFMAAQDHIIAVNPFGSKEACLTNRRGLRQSLLWLRKGGALIVFPAGEVSSFHPSRGAVSDPPWSESIARLAVLSKAPVLPMFISGSNGIGFQLAGLMHPCLRTALLCRELFNKSGKTIYMRSGSLVSSKRLCEFQTDRGAIEFLRRKTYLLAHHEETTGRLTPRITAIKQCIAIPKRGREAIVEPTDRSQMAMEVARLDNSALLASQGDHVVYIAGATAVPHVVREIGRLREITFRNTGEGTGRSIDLDEFDSYYLHLFVWNRAEKEVIGAYRLGQSDLILRNLGLRGLYTRKLFAYRRQFLERITPALEMGRSFVRIEYQRTYSPLLLLWRGISTYVCRNPRYRFLFGPVSISNDYRPGSRQLIVTFLKEYCRAPDLARLVRARSPFRTRPARWWDAGAEPGVSWDIEELSAIIADIEVDRKGVPVLLKQYLKLGGKLVSFNIDGEFANAVDGLLVLDLLQSDPKLLERYMGKPGLQIFLEHHSRAVPQAQ